MKSIITLILVLFLSGCVGDKVQSYSTKKQKYSWGHMHAWMSKNYNEQSDPNGGSGYLLFNFLFKKSVLNRSCIVTIHRVYLQDPNTQSILLDEKPLRSDSTKMRKEVKGYRNLQFSLSNYPFDYNQDSFPYDLTIDMEFECEGNQTIQQFSKPIEFRMVQPVIWQQ